MRSYVFTVRFDGFLNQVALVKYYSALLKSDFVIQKMNVSILDKSKPSWKLKFKSYKMSDKSLDKLSQTQESLTRDEIMDVELLSVLQGSEFASKDIEFSMMMSHKTENRSLTFIFSEPKAKEFDWQKFVSTTVERLSIELIKIKYGFGFLIENRVMPAFYVQGVSSDNLTKHEEFEVSKWASQQGDCERKIWDLFPINIFSEQHMSVLKSNSYIFQSLTNSYKLLESNGLFIAISNQQIIEQDQFRHTGENNQVIKSLKNLGLLM
jgi:hypothetical protein